MGGVTYGLLTSLFQDADHGIVILLNMKIQEMLSREVLPALQTAVRVSFSIMHIVLFESCESERAPMWWEGASHFRGRGRIGVDFTALWVELDEFGG